ncbi:stress-activated protein kinase alpha-like [Schistocerca gregaria]|uniref:stress-activated protein kinase alpha-like n=1 Tax=Schistocerca gregaria TaxID=7010 RepID=UPI00211EC616|nr:stress-activated protein kinase alpha-like [Schistocerca gregaria]
MFHGKKGPFSLVEDKKIWFFNEILDIDKDEKHIRMITTNNKKYNFGSLGEYLDRCYHVLQRTLFGVLGNSALHVAVDERNYERVSQILDHDVTKIHVFNSVQQSPLHLAFYKNDVEMVKLILKYYLDNQDKIDINFLSPKTENTSLHVACSISTICDEILDMLLNMPTICVEALNADANTPLHFFCQNNHSLNCKKLGSMMISLAENKAEYLAQYNRNKETAMHKAVFNKKFRLFMVSMLVKHHAAIDMRNEQNETPLHYAVRLGREDLCYALLEAGADPSLKTANGSTALDIARRTLSEDMNSHSARAIVRLLKQVEELRLLLQECGLLDYAKQFIINGWYDPARLVSLNEQTLKEHLMVFKLGPQIQLFKRIEQMKARWEQEEQAKQLQRQTEEKGTQKRGITRPAAGSISLVAKERNPGATHEVKLSRAKNRQQIGLAQSPNRKQRYSLVPPIRPKQAALVLPESSLSSSENIEQVRTELGLAEGDWEIDGNDLEFTKKLGSGTSGQVYRGLFKGKEVAIKVLTAVEVSEQLDEFRKELTILTKLHSPFMVTFYGASIEPNLTMVFEYCPRGSLYHVLNNKQLDLSWDLALTFCLEMACGMQVLHSFSPSPIVHRDLKSLNLLVTSDWHLKVCDFGLSRVLGSRNLETFKKLCGTFAYCAPEIFNGGTFTVRSDVYSMGIVLWEIVNRTVKRAYASPFSEFKNLNYDFQIIVQASQGLRPTIPSKLPENFKTLISRCIDERVEARPTTKQVVDMLASLRQDYLRNPQPWLACIEGEPPS